MINIVPVTNNQLLKKFIDFPHELYRNEPNYVPELFIAQRDLLTKGKHPFHEHSSIQLFLAVKGKTVRGRIAAILNNNHNIFNNAREGFFGFFECVDDLDIFQSLMDKAIEWLKEKGLKTVIGPVNPTTNDPCGLLIEGYDLPPVVMTPFNFSYYSNLLESMGFSKKVDLLSYYLKTTSVNQRSLNLLDALLKRLQQKQITIRPINMKNFAAEASKIKEVYNSAWDKNMGFVPMTDKEFSYLAKDLKQILDPKYCLVAEQNGRIIGFALAVPDINQILIKIKRGRLLPTGIFKLLFGLKKVSQVRVLALGVIDGYKKMGIEACFYAMIIKRAMEKGLEGGEASWILENNYLMNKGIQGMNGVIYKKYRLYQKDI
jgi:GNAT superfamily N-acetyltransferase